MEQVMSKWEWTSKGEWMGNPSDDQKNQCQCLDTNALFGTIDIIGRKEKGRVKIRGETLVLLVW